MANNRADTGYQILDTGFYLNSFLFTRNTVEIIEKSDFLLPNEIVAEIVYVLEKVYDVPRNKVAEILKDLFTSPNFHFRFKFTD